MNDRINQALTKLFDQRRIIFWYDAKREVREECEALQLDGEEKVKIAGNEFGPTAPNFSARPGWRAHASGSRGAARSLTRSALT